eukprot:11027368-Lingulodinium_polyedra.AAC.1
MMTRPRAPAHACVGTLQGNARATHHMRTLVWHRLPGRRRAPKGQHAPRAMATNMFLWRGNPRGLATD